MISYIVRIYREEENNPRNFVGTVEEAGELEKRAFTSMDELWAILNPGEKKNEKNERAEANARSDFRSSRSF